MLKRKREGSDHPYQYAFTAEEALVVSKALRNSMPKRYKGEKRPKLKRRWREMAKRIWMNDGVCPMDEYPNLGSWRKDWS